MHLGILARTFPRPSFEQTLDAITERGLTHVQFNMSCTGQPTLPERMDEHQCVWIARSFRERGLTMAAISGTFNLCDPEPTRLAENLRRLESLAAACRWLDTRIITICTGTRDPDDMWKWHPENVRRSAWDSLVGSVRDAVRIADRNEVILAFEPERNNVVNSVARARMLLDAIASPWLKVVIDPANLLRDGEHDRFEETLDEAFDWLGPDIVLAHAKEPVRDYADDEMIAFSECQKRNPFSLLLRPLLAAGLMELMSSGQTVEDKIRGLEELQAAPISRRLFENEWFFNRYIHRLTALGYDGALLMHGMEESQVGRIRNLLSHMLNSVR